MIGNYKVITLCGSTRFKEAFLEVQKRLTLDGNIVISVGLFGHAGDEEVWEGMAEDTVTKTKEMLDDMHKRKIDMADGIYVLNVGGYIGESTRSEIEYAIAAGKDVEYLEPDKLPPASADGERGTMTNRKTVPISVIVRAIEETFDGWEQYYNTVTGKVEAIPERYNDVIDWSEYEELSEKIDESEDYIRLPSQRELHEYDIMERFALEHNSNPLLRALRGRRPFRTFKDRAAQIGLIQEYYAFLSAAYVEIAREWCRENEVPFSE